MNKKSIVKNGIMASGGKGEISQDSLDKINAFTESVKPKIELITGRLPEKSDKVDELEKQWGSSDRVVVLVRDVPTNSFAFGRYRHNMHLKEWSIEGYNGDWEVIGWLPLPDVSEFEPKGVVDE